MKPSKRHPLPKKESKEVTEVLEKYISIDGKPERVEVAVFKDFEIYIIDGKPALARIAGHLIPVLSLLITNSERIKSPVIRVDRGASLALARGADLMAPGVRGFMGDFEQGDIVIVVDDESRAPVMVGRALVSSRDLKAMIETKSKGKVIESIHYVGDEIWKACVTL